MRILYGISSAGLDPTWRARGILAGLVALGHEVRIATAGRTAAILGAHGFEVIDLAGDVESALEQGLRFQPDVVLTDFSYFACLVARLAQVPCLPLGRETRRAAAGSYGRATRRS